MLAFDTLLDVAGEFGLALVAEATNPLSRFPVDEILTTSLRGQCESRLLGRVVGVLFGEHLLRLGG